MHAPRQITRSQRRMPAGRLHVAAGLIAVLLSLAPLPAAATGEAAAKPDEAATTSEAPAAAKMTMDDFLDRLMIAESGGRDTAKNPLSTATGAFQFIESTWLSLVRQEGPGLGLGRAAEAVRLDRHGRPKVDDPAAPGPARRR